MAWYDDYLQQGKGLIQGWKNDLTGNNLTSQDPNVIRAMNMQANNPFDPNARISAPTTSLDYGNRFPPVYNPTSFSDRRYEETGGVHPKGFLPRDTSGMYAPDSGNIHRDPTNWREDNQYIHNQFGVPPNYAEMRKDVKRDSDGIMAIDQAQKQKKSIFDYMPGNVMLSNFAEKFKRPEEMQTAYEAITGSADKEGYGTYKGNEYRIEGNKIYSELFPGGKNFDSMFGSGSIEEMEMDPNKVGSIGWAQKRLQQGKNISQRLRDILTRRGIRTTGDKKRQGIWMNRPTGEGAQFGTPVAIPPQTIKKIHHDQGRDTPTPESWNRDQGGGYTTARGFTKADTGGRGHHGNWADGGRIGYQGGELVGQETDFIRGPQGVDEFQETVVEGQEEPSREELEALAMDIFQLPLEELNEEQLMVVYQAAMQEQPVEEDFQEQDIQYADRGQPMEEDISEEDIQYAAGGGRAGYLFGDRVEQQTDFIEGPQDDLMASSTSFGDDRNKLSLQLFGKEMHLLNEIELEQLEEEIERLMGKFMGAEGGLASIL